MHAFLKVGVAIQIVLHVSHAFNPTDHDRNADADRSSADGDNPKPTDGDNSNQTDPDQNSSDGPISDHDSRSSALEVDPDLDSSSFEDTTDSESFCSSEDEQQDNSSDSDCDAHDDTVCSDDEDEELDIDKKMFEPLYKNASITVCGAYCAIMEFKRACRLPFTTIKMLLQLLQLLCPPSSALPQSMHRFRKFFKKFSSSHQKRLYCSDCNKEFKENQSHCEDPSCHHKGPSTLISFDPDKAIRRVLKSKFGTKFNHATVPSFCMQGTGKI